MGVRVVAVVVVVVAWALMWSRVMLIYFFTPSRVHSPPSHFLSCCQFVSPIFHLLSHCPSHFPIFSILSVCQSFAPFYPPFRFFFFFIVIGLVVSIFFFLFRCSLYYPFPLYFNFGQYFSYFTSIFVNITRFLTTQLQFYNNVSQIISNSFFFISFINSLFYNSFDPISKSKIFNPLETVNKRNRKNSIHFTVGGKSCHTRHPKPARLPNATLYNHPLNMGPYSVVLPINI